MKKINHHGKCAGAILKCLLQHSRKNTGQGTGLGLTLADDIITKEHNGTIKAEGKEEESVFTINVPV